MFEGLTEDDLSEGFFLDLAWSFEELTFLAYISYMLSIYYVVFATKFIFICMSGVFDFSYYLFLHVFFLVFLVMCI